MGFNRKQTVWGRSAFRTLYAGLALLLSMASPAAADTVQVSGGSELNAAISGATSNRVIELTQDIDAVTSSTYGTAVAFTIDGKGHAINGNGISKTALRFSNKSAKVTVKNATLKNMVSALSYGGGAVGVYKGALTVENCAFIGNKTTAATGTENGGGAIVGHSEYSTLSVKNSTFYGNSTGGNGGAILSKKGAATIDHCTVAGNTAAYGGGIGGSASSSKLKISNSVVVDNSLTSGTAGADLYNFTDSGWNLLGVSSAAKASTSKTSLTAEGAGLEAGAPRDNGGEGGSPYTIALLSGSMAIDGGSSALKTDQRGAERDEKPDIGAHEFTDAGAVRKPAATPPAGAYKDEPSVTLTNRTEGAAIYYTLDGSDPGKNSALYSEPIPIAKATTIKAIAVLGDAISDVMEASYTLFTDTPAVSPAAGAYYEAQNVTLTAAEGAVIFYTLNGDTPDRNSLQYASGDPIQLHNEGSFTLKAIAYLGETRESSVMTAAYAITLPKTVEVSDGAGLVTAIKDAGSGYLTTILLTDDIDAVTTATFTANALIKIDGKGHAINGGGTGNTALRFSGSGADVTLKDVTMRNMATSLKYGGGAVGVYKGKLTIENCAFTGNKATAASSGGGGAVVAHSSSVKLSVRNSTFCDNTSSSEGGAIWVSAGGEIVNCTIAGNKAQSKGGAFRNDTSTLTSQTGFSNSIVVGNSGSEGPDIYRGRDDGSNIFGSNANVNVASGVTASTTGYTVTTAGLETDGEGKPSLKNNGGLTPTIALLESSPAIGAANSAKAPQTDQRGASRKETPDIGAYEFNAQVPGESDDGGGDGNTQPGGDNGGNTQPGDNGGNTQPGENGGNTQPGENGGNTQPGDNGGNTQPGDNGGNTQPGDNGGNTQPGDNGGNTQPGDDDKNGQPTNVSSGAELNDAITNAKDGDVIALTNDIDAVTSATYETKAAFIIDGKGHAINGKGAADTALRFEGSGVDVTLRNVTMRNMVSGLKYGGGAIGVYKGGLTVENSAFIGNKAFSAEMYSASDKSNERGGGAVLAHNKASVLKVKNSTFYGNSTAGSGGAILSKEGVVEIINSTIVNNTAGAPIVRDGEDDLYAGSKMSGGGVYNSAPEKTAMFNSIVAGNIVKTGTDSDTGNVEYGGDSLVAQDIGTLKIKAGEPEDNGGEGGSPYTIALLDGSPAIDAANSEKAPAADQRGAQRDAKPDIGAYEFKAQAPGGGNDGNTQPGGGNGGNAQPGGGNDGNAQPGGGNDGNAQPGGGNGGNTQPGGGNDGNAQPGGGNDGNTQPGGGNDGNAQPSGGNDGNAQSGGKESVTAPNTEAITEVVANETKVIITYNDGKQVTYDTETQLINISYLVGYEFEPTAAFQNNIVQFRAAQGVIIPAGTKIVYSVVRRSVASDSIGTETETYYTLYGTSTVVDGKSILTVDMTDLPSGVYDITYKSAPNSNPFFSGVLVRGYEHEQLNQLNDGSNSSSSPGSGGCSAGGVIFALFALSSLLIMKKSR